MSSGSYFPPPVRAEVCYLLPETATLTDDATGTTHRLPVGWSSRRDVTQTLRKFYAIY